MLEILIAIAAGALTIGAPCILPMLPILLGASVGQRHRARPLFITLGFVLSFTVVALLLATLTRSFGLSPDALRTVAIALLGLFGISLVWPTPFERLTAHLSGLMNRAGTMSQRVSSDSFGGFGLGVLLGLLWTPCAGPVLGAILTLIATSTDLTRAGILLAAYAVGAGIPMLAIAYGGQLVTTRVRTIARYAGALQRVFGGVILALAVAMFFGYDLVLQAKLLDVLPNLNPKL